MQCFERFQNANIANAFAQIKTHQSKVLQALQFSQEREAAAVYNSGELNIQGCEWAHVADMENDGF